MVANKRNDTIKGTIMADQSEENGGTHNRPSATPRPRWTTPELIEMNIWSDTGAKGSYTTESVTTKSGS